MRKNLQIWVNYEKKWTFISENELKKGDFGNLKVPNPDFSTKSVPTQYDFCNSKIPWSPKIRTIRGPPVFPFGGECHASFHQKRVVKKLGQYDRIPNFLEVFQKSQKTSLTKQTVHIQIGISILIQKYFQLVAKRSLTDATTIFYRASFDPLTRWGDICFGRLCRKIMFPYIKTNGASCLKCILSSVTKPEFVIILIKVYYIHIRFEQVILGLQEF